jgi:hypothetical protein
MTSLFRRIIPRTMRQNIGIIIRQSRQLLSVDNCMGNKYEINLIPQFRKTDIICISFNYPKMWRLNQEYFS